MLFPAALTLVLTAAPVCTAAVDRDPKNCGECLNVCTFANATPGCDQGHCRLLSCAPHFGDCDFDLGNGCEEDLLTSPANCGACGKACSGGGCVAGSCAAAPRTVSAVTSASWLAADSSRVYWFGSNPDKSISIWSVSVDGGTPSELLTGIEQPHFLMRSASSLFWREHDRLEVSTLAQPAKRTLPRPPAQSPGSEPAFPVADEQGVVFVIDTRRGQFGHAVLQVMSASADGGQEKLGDLTANGVCAIAIDSRNIYVRTFEPYDIVRVPRGGGPQTHVATPKGQGCAQMVLGNDALYWSDQWLVGGLLHYGIVTARIPGGSAELIAERPNRPEQLAFDRGRLFWAEQPVTPLERSPPYDVYTLTAKGVPQRVATNQPGMQDLVASNGRLFWTIAILPKLIDGADGGQLITPRICEVRELDE